MGEPALPETCRLNQTGGSFAAFLSQVLYRFGPSCARAAMSVRLNLLFAVAGLEVLLGLPALAAPNAIDPCPLLTVPELSAVVGRSMAAGKFFDNGVTRDGAHSSSCLWVAPLAAGAKPDPTQRLGGRGFVVLNVINWPKGPNDARKFLRSFDDAFHHKDITSRPVAVDVGADEAMWWGDGVAGRKGGVSFGISVAQLGDKSTRQPRAENLARLLVKRLPPARP
jgi:hypothetical protein